MSLKKKGSMEGNKIIPDLSGLDVKKSSFEGKKNSILAFPVINKRREGS